ncbi:MAG: PqqD family protein [Acidobacteria bacterium]|nr:PqqD family protein [Acidobacteriota bacterium]
MLRNKRIVETRSAGIYPKAASEDLVVQNTADELLVYDLKKNRAICLNKTAALVWENCDGKSDIKTIIKRIEVKLSAPVEEEVMLLALSELNKEGLLVDGDIIREELGGLSRREIIKKIGFGSLVALPMVSAIVAPRAINAQSGAAACVNPGGAPGGSPGSTCFSSSVPQCQGICNNSCCSGSGTLIFDPGNVCNGSVAGCGCTCNP